MDTDLIKTITRKLNDLSNGTLLNDHTPVEIPENTSDEIQALCRNVNNLCKMQSENIAHIEQKLKKSYEQLSRHSKELEDLNLIKDQFFAIIAHELRGPVGSIDAFLEQIIFYFDKIEKEKLLPDIKLIKETSQSTFELLERLLIWAKTQKNEISYIPKPHNISRLIDSNISLFSLSINDKELIVTNKVSENTIAFFDYDMIKTVVRNLINNAIKFSNIRGKIEVSASKIENNMLEVRICDNGIGMDKQTLDNLFRLDVKHKSCTGTKGEKGTGMGLILTKEFVNRHGGNIRYISEPGKGSCAIFTIPCNNTLLL